MSDAESAAGDNGAAVADAAEDVAPAEEAPQEVAEEAESAKEVAGDAAEEPDSEGGPKAENKDDAGAQAAPAEGEPDKKRRMFVGGLAWGTTLDTMRGYFQKFGTVTDCSIQYNGQTGKSRGFGFVTMASYEDAMRVRNAQHILDGRTLQICDAAPPKQAAVSKRVYIGGLPPDVNEEDVSSVLVTKLGNIDSLQIMRFPDTGKSRGFAFVTFTDEDVARKAVESPRGTYQIKGSPILITPAQPKNMGPKGGGGGGGGGYHGGYGGRGGYGGY
eukprot:scaffold4178_cov257-Pinguiococcus_pyrenoidosus.AAC.10